MSLIDRLDNNSNPVYQQESIEVAVAALPVDESSDILESLMPHIDAAVSSVIERRAAIDVGSGSTKFSIADVDTSSQKIVKVILDTSFAVPYQAALESSYDGNFDAEIRSLGIKTFLNIKEIAQGYQVQKIVAVATAAFRSAANGIEFAEEIFDSTGIDIQIISQKEEGDLAFASALAVINDQDAEEIVVWDIGTGSVQMSTLLSDENITVFKGELGSVPFKNYIIDVIQEKDSRLVKSPNPMTEDEYAMADRAARALARKAYPVIKDKISSQNMVIGIGRLFYHSLFPLVGKDGVITRKELRTFINSSLGKTDKELNDSFAHVNVSNCILVLAFMKALHIHEIAIADTTTTKGLLAFDSYWENAQIA